MSTRMMFERRLEMFRLHLHGIKPTRIIRQMLEDKAITVSEPTLWRDWQTRNEWMPVITKITKGAGDLPVAETIGALMEARRLAFNTYLRADNPNARVGALRIIKELVETEVGLRQSLGLLSKEPDKVEHELGVKIPDITDEDTARYVPVILKVALEQEVRDFDEDPAEEDPPEPMG